MSSAPRSHAAWTGAECVRRSDASQSCALSRPAAAAAAAASAAAAAADIDFSVGRRAVPPPCVCVCVCVVHRSAACLCVHASPPARPPRALAYSRRVIVVCRTRNGRCVTSQPRARVCDVTVTSPSRSSSMWCCRWRTATERRVSRRAPVAHSHAHILTRHT